jgi:hypothetical protein
MLKLTLCGAVALSRAPARPEPTSPAFRAGCEIGGGEDSSAHAAAPDEIDDAQQDGSTDE